MRRSRSFNILVGIVVCLLLGFFIIRSVYITNRKNRLVSTTEGANDTPDKSVLYRDVKIKLKDRTLMARWVSAGPHALQCLSYMAMVKIWEIG